MKYQITKAKFTRYIYTGNNELTRTEGGPVPYEINVVRKTTSKYAVEDTRKSLVTKQCTKDRC